MWLTVPAAWDAMGCQMMREAAITAGLVQSSRAGDREWRDRLRIITCALFSPCDLHLTDLDICIARAVVMSLILHYSVNRKQPLFIAHISLTCINCNRIKIS